ncbi:hypothetical protein [uncultured Salinicola sp.]|uniref:hypothetical protein n=1 Tax=uncultured Salinicola sp. TaxID=1193542 RepID=UPI00260DE187|nr:hypothetical protein [uncultured Salinicola sp.]|tara:strand:- start:3050 stop:3901 length:852 start_codon:yes stop_codon:yes gene_type:complete
MRDYVRAGEVAAILGLDTKASPWTVWNRMTDDVEENDIGDRSRWQGRLAADIAAGIAKDHGLSIQKALDPVVGEGIMPPRAWEIAPSTKTKGKPAVLVVMQRIQSAMFGWEAPDRIPDKQLMRYLATAIAYGHEDVYVGILVDGYRSELYRATLDEDMRTKIVEGVADMIRMAVEDDEPVVDYDVDKGAIREGKVSVKAEVSGDTVDALIDERETKKAEIDGLKARQKPLEKRIEQIDNMVMTMIPKGSTIDTGTRIVGVEEKSGGKLALKIAKKSTDAASLF